MKRLFCAAFACVTVIFMLSSCRSYSPAFNGEALALECGTDIQVYNDDPYIVVMPENPSAGMIFFPGGLVSYASYLPLMVQCAKKNIACFIIRMPEDFAILNINAATRVTKRYTSISRWYISGHSLGGAMAANFIAGNASSYEGLILLAAYSTKDISHSGLKVLSCYGTNDKVLNMANYEKYRPNLPDDSVEKKIEGGNHGQFGNYGFQAGDGEASITSQEQQSQTADAIASLMFS